MTFLLNVSIFLSSFQPIILDKSSSCGWLTWTINTFWLPISCPFVCEPSMYLLKMPCAISHWVCVEVCFFSLFLLFFFNIGHIVIRCWDDTWRIMIRWWTIHVASWDSLELFGIGVATWLSQRGLEVMSLCCLDWLMCYQNTPKTKKLTKMPPKPKK